MNVKIILFIQKGRMMVMHEKNAKKLKGSALYTVMLVISVMMILMLTAIALSGAAYRRASSEFRDDQTTSTARSVVTTILESLNKQAMTDAKGDSLAKALSQGLKNVNDTVTLKVEGDSGSSTLPGFGNIESVTFTNVGVDNESGYFINNSGQNIIKVTATVSFGNDKTNTTTYTQYVTNKIESDAQSGGSGGFIASGGAELGASTGVKIFGESYTGIEDITVESNPVTFRNPAVLAGGAIYNSTSYFTTGNSRIELSAYSGIKNNVYVNGNLAFKNPTYVKVRYSESEANIKRIQDLPNIFVKGTFLLQNTLSSEGDANGFNILTGRYYCCQAQPFGVCANIFCYNSEPDVNVALSGCTDAASVENLLKAGEIKNDYGEDDFKYTSDHVNDMVKSTSSISIIRSNTGPNGSPSGLIGWANTLLGNDQKGSIYSKGSVWIQGEFSVNEIVAEGALMVGVSNSNANGDVHVMGDIHADTVCISNNKYHLICDGTVYCNNFIGDSTNLNIAPETQPIINYFPAGMRSYDELIGKDNGQALIQTPENARAKFYDDVQGKYKTTVNTSHLNISNSTKIYYSGADASAPICMQTPGKAGTPVGTNKEVTIGESCTLVGAFKNCTINIVPQSGNDLWINLFNLKLDNSMIIVDESNAKVNFFIPIGDNYCETAPSDVKSNYIDTVNQHTTFTGALTSTDNTFVADKSSIITKNYLDTYLTQNGQLFNITKKLDLKTYYTKEEEATLNMVPDINIYAADNVKDNSGNHVGPQFTCTNDCTVTGNLISPYTRFSFIKGAIQYSNNLGYTVAGTTEKVDLNNIQVDNVSWIGSALFGELAKAENDFVFFYVSRAANDNNSAVDEGTFKWALIDGYATY